MPLKVKGIDGSDRGWYDFNACLVILGKTPDLPPDDPNVPGPKAVVTIAELRAGIDNAPNKWVGKQVTVNGTYESINFGVAMTIGDGDKSSALLSCMPPAGQKPPEQKTPSARVKVKGKVHDPRVRVESIGLLPDLDDCRF